MNHKYISNLVREQFPAFYKEEGQDFIQFVKNYYEFLEDTDQPINKIRSLTEYGDIDETLDDYLRYFVNKYMKGVPLSTIGNKRFLEKHILDLYRSKGSIEGMKLLFRLLYNEEIDVYIPSADILIVSDGKWIVKQYVEITENEKNRYYDQEYITGSSSQATAIVEGYERRIINDKPIHILFLSNIKGQFFAGETITSPSVTSESASRIRGSVNSINVITGSIGVNVGDTFMATTGSGQGLRLVVTETDNLAGIIEFTLVDGGFGYSNDAIITISAGSNTTGSDANFIIGSLSNTSIFQYNDVLLEPYESIPIDANNYASSNSDNSAFASANLDTLIEDAIEYSNVEVGTISSLIVTNPGTDYDGSVLVEIIDPYTSTAGIPNGQGGFWGTDANVTGLAAYGDGVVSNTSVKDSGFGYYINNEQVTFVSESNNAISITANVSLSGIGTSEGFWKNTDGFIDEDKYIQDSFFYQEFSYQIKSSRSLQRYIGILKKLMHPVGNEAFGRVVINSEDQQETAISSTVTQS